MKVRRFNIDKNGAVMTQDGEFLHINDIMLLLKEERDSVIDYMKMNEEVSARPSKDDDFIVKQQYAYKHRLEFIDRLIDKVRRQD